MNTGGKTSTQQNGEGVYATRPVINRVALVFDFDETLAPDSFTALLEHCGFDPDAFEAKKIKPLLDDGWDKKLARFYVLRKEAEERDDVSLTAETFAEVARNLELYPEATEMFERVAGYARAIVSDIEVEFYLLTAGMLEIPRATSIADRFRTMWGGELYFDEESGELDSVKRMVSYQDKIRYILKLCKGLDIDEPQINHDVYREIAEEEWHVPLSQVIYVGDGDSDMPVFAYLAEHEGLAISVHKSQRTDDWEGYEDVHEGRRVQNLAPADYREASELMQSLKLAVESICKRIALRQLSRGE